MTDCMCKVHSFCVICLQITPSYFIENKYIACKVYFQQMFNSVEVIPFGAWNLFNVELL